MMGKNGGGECAWTYDIPSSDPPSFNKDIPEEHENGKCCRYEIMVDESLLLWFYFEGVVL